MTTAIFQGFECCPQQRRLWSLGESASALVCEAAVLIDGRFDRQALEQALRTVTARHEILRTTFHGAPGSKSPLQQVSPPGPVTIQDRVCDSGPSLDDCLSRLFDPPSPPPLDPAAAALSEVDVLALDDRRHLLFLRLPALCADAETLSLLTSEIATAYSGNGNGNGNAADDETLQYADLAAWQNQLLTDPESEAGFHHWRETGFRAWRVPTLPGEKAVETPRAFLPRSTSLRLRPALAARLETLRGETPASWYFLACWLLVLARITGRDEFLLGVAFDARSHEVLAKALGPMTRYLPLAASLSANDDLHVVARALAKAGEEAALWQQTFSWDAVDGGPAARLDFCFEALVDPPAVAATGATFRLLRRRACVDPFKLKLSCSTADETVRCELHYDSSLYSATCARSLLRRFETALEGAVVAPRAPLSVVDLRSAGERHALGVEFNDTARGYPEACIHHLFEQQVARTPTAPAVRFGHLELSYRELDERASALAGHLSSLGVGPEERVGICLQRSDRMPLAVLAVLKAGGAFVPLDPSYPPARLAFLLEDSSLRLLVTDADSASRLPEHTAAIVCLDADWSASAPVGPTAACPDNLAYVIYTSGSTGRPKGTLVPHRGLVNYLTWCAAAYGIEAGKSSAVHTSLSFDLTLTTLLAPLLHGGRIDILPEGPGVEPLARALREGAHFDFLKLTPSQLDLLELSLPADARDGLGTLILGGENLSWAHLARWAASAPQAIIVNEYGPTETVVGCCVHRRRLDDPPARLEGASLPIGRPTGNASLFVLDREMTPVPPGAIGEIFIGGESLARGYLDRPGLTAASFVPHRFGPDPGRRLYRTGDLARHLPAGELEFLGRRDDQVKVRGFRVELGEIEFALRQHPRVRDAVVTGGGHGTDAQRLFAYTVARGAEAPAPADDLRRYLAQRLPGHMVPAAFVALDRLPLTPNGKVDREALPEPQRLQRATSDASPRSLSEELVAVHWRDLLAVQQAGIHDDFFKHGGDSLLAAQLAFRLCRDFAVSLTVQAVFESPTIARLAHCVDTLVRSGEPSDLSITPRPTGSEVPLSFAQERLWVLDQLQPGGSTFNVPLALRLTGALDGNRIERCLATIVERHEPLRATFQEVDGRPVQVLSPGWRSRLHRIDLRGLSTASRGRELEALAAREAVRPFDLARGPILRATLVQVAQEEHALLLTMHHIASDGWSSSVLVRESTALYQEELRSDTASLPDLPIRYGDFAAWQRRWLSGRVLGDQLAYWRRQLDGAPILQLPTDRPRPPLQSYAGAHLGFRLGADLCAQLEPIGQRRGATLFMTLLTAYQVVLSRLSGQDDFLIGMPVANRTRSEVEGLIGLFVNTLVLRADLDGDPTFAELLERTRKTTFGAYAHQDLPFEKLVDGLEIARDPSRSPLFQVGLALHNVPLEGMDLPGIKACPMALETGTSKYDLSLDAMPRAGGLDIVLEYRTDLFDATTIRRFFGSFQACLRAAVADPEQRVFSYELAPPERRHQERIEWNSAPMPRASGEDEDEALEGGYPGLVERQARRRPDAPALLFDGKSWSYGQLDRQANRLAHLLQARGAGNETVIGVHLNSCPDLVISLLAVLKSGGVYLPLDPAYPAEYRARVLADSDPRLVISRTSLAAGLDGFHDRILLLDQEDDLSQQPETAPTGPVSPSALACVVYTSGSTGRPKGVMLTHGGLRDLVSSQRQGLGVEQGDRILQFAAPSQGASIAEICITLAAGATLVLAESDTLRSPSALAQLLDASGVTIATLPPTLLAQLPADAGPELRMLICAGDACPPDLVGDHLRTGRIVVNAYGSTETTVGVTLARCTLPASGLLPIGRPTAGVAVRVLDRKLQPVPWSAVGEVCVSSSRLARGYLGQPSRTAEAFVPDPFSQEPGERLFRTGDLAFWRHDGLLDFEGRIDQLPLNGDGKLDRKQLPAPDAAKPDPVDHRPVSHGSARTSTHEKLAAIWSQVLGIDRVGIHDNFFELGGDSILVIQIVSRARAAGLEIEPLKLFTHQTIAALATVSRPSGPHTAREPASGDAPLTPIQHWFFEQRHPRPAHWNQPLMLAARQPLDPRLVRAAVAAVANHHDALRLRFIETPEGWRQSYAVAVEPMKMPCVDFSGIAAERRSACLEAAAGQLQSRLTLDSAPLSRLAWFDLGDRTGVRLLWVIHHLVVDAVSWRILIEDLATAYGQLSSGDSVQLQATTDSYKDWAGGLVELAKSGALDQEAIYWRPAATRRLPTEQPADRNDEASVERLSRALDSPRTHALLREAHRAYRTEIPDLIVTALARTLTAATQDDSTWIELEGHGRDGLVEGVDVTRTMGWFTSLWPVHLSGVAEEEPGSAIRAVKEKLRAAPHRGSVFGLLRYLSPNPELRARLGAIPRPDVLFNYLGQLDGVIRNDGPFTLAEESFGAIAGKDNLRSHPLQITAAVIGGQLELTWSYSRRLHRTEFVENLAQECLRHLAVLIDHCLTPGVGSRTPSDFPLAEVDQSTLDALAAAPAASDGIEALYPLSPMQEGMLFHYLEDPASGVYLSQLAATISGVVDDRAFEQAWRLAVARHSSLRTAFLWEGLARPLQLVRPTIDLSFERHDWRPSHGHETSGPELAVFLAEDRRRGFAPDRDPLLRLTWIALPGDDSGPRHHLVLTVHHLVLDGWSLSKVLADVLRAYQPLVAGGSIDLGPAPPYEHYIRWLNSHRRDDTEYFWRAELEGFSEPTPLLLECAARDRRPAERDYRAARLELDEETTAALGALSRERRLTLNTLLVGAWALLLTRYSGENDVVFGVTVSGRPAHLEGVEDAVGLFLNTLPLRARLGPDTLLIDWLHQIQERQIRMREFEGTPLVDIQHWSAVERGRPLFESIVIFENYPMDKALANGDLPFEVTALTSVEESHYPLTVVVLPENRLSVGLYYDANHFETTSVMRMAAHLERILTWIAHGAHGAVGKVPLLTRSEEHALLRENAVSTAGPAQTCIHHLFERRAAADPQALAVIADGVELTYGELGSRAECLASRLQRLGVAPETLVGICLPRSPEMVVAVLAVLKAGGAYVPLDPGYPRERLEFMVADSGLGIVVTDSGLDRSLSLATPHKVLVDAEEQGPRLPPGLQTGSDSLAYVIYTSGSTGRPKGVLVRHGAVTQVLHHALESAGLGPGDRVLQAASLSFDASALEIFASLAAGAAVCLVDEETLVDGRRLAKHMKRHQVTTFIGVPSLLQLLPAGAYPDLRILISGGESCPPDTVARWSPGRLFLNAYAPTETTIYTTAMHCHGPATKAPPVGRPIPGGRIYVLGSAMKPSPIGVAGEVFVGGAGVARGYLGRPRLTAERFVPDPLSDVPGGRLYRSGDLGRWLPDGNLQLLGRIDDQVKIHGYRIELGEIEAVLLEEPAVRRAVVVVREDVPGDRRLVAYVDMADEGESVETELRQRLQRHLPQYMVPSKILLLEDLPLTATGKIDRQALPAPAALRTQPSACHLELGTDIERQIAAIWSQVLSVETIGLHDNFFDLGGQSLLIIRLREGLEKRFERSVSIADLFRNPTVHDQAAWLEGGHTDDRTADERAAVRSARRQAAVRQTARRRGREPALDAVGSRERESDD